MEMVPTSSYSEILNEYIDRKKNPIKPIIVKEGPCKENILVGDEVDLFAFPAPFLHGWDGGRFIGTWNMGMCKDPDSDWVNWGMYRLMIHDKNSTGVYITPTQHIGMIYLKYEGRNEPMPYVAFIGPDPTIGIVTVSPLPYGISEVDIAGAIRREPVPLVKCETVDLYVPATAEIVLEGEVLPHLRKDEGPFGEYAGYQVSGVVPRPVFKVKAITHRNDPIITSACTGIPTDDVAIYLGTAAELKTTLIEMGIPIVEICVPAETSGHLCIVSTKTPYPYVANRIASCIWAHKAGFLIPRIMVVNDDIDPTNLEEVIHAFATKCHPIRGTTVMERAYTSHITGFLNAFERTKGFGANVVYDCTWPLDWKPEEIPPRASFDNIYPQEIKDKVLSKWKIYGFKEG